MKADALLDLCFSQPAGALIESVFDVEGVHALHAEGGKPDRPDTIHLQRNANTGSPSSTSSTEQSAGERPVWHSLTAREQDVAALACLGYTNREIGARLNISAETVKVRLQRALAKFGVTTRSQLRMLLEGWDFTAWEKPRYR